MFPTDRRSVLRFLLWGSAAFLPSHSARALTNSLSDLGGTMVQNADAVIYTAREVVTLDPARPTAQAVAVLGDRIHAAGTLSEVTAALDGHPYRVDDRYSGHVIVPGFIAQHDHPILAALTMASVILSIEDWVLPGGTVPAVRDKADFIARLTEAVSAAPTVDEPILTWGYHPSFYGRLTRSDLDAISTQQPILAWARSCHEMVLNSAALARGGVTADTVAGFSDTAQEQANFDEGRFWEQGFFAVLPNIGSMVASPERLRTGLELSRDYMRAKGITIGNEPGGILSKQVQDGVNAVFGAADMPFRWSFMADGKSLIAAQPDDARVIADTEALAGWYGGMTSLAPKQIKLFADGAIYSQLMQVRDPFLDGHKGEWMMDLDQFQRAFRVYWDAGYQLHVHVNGDAGLDRVLDTLETNLRRTPRDDHRTTIVHFAVSGADQVLRIRDLGAIVSANPYYVAALADNYGEVGLGPDRADNMVRLGDVEAAGISWSLHSDMPMAPCDPLFLMWCAVNRVTSSGRVAGPAQRVSAETALRGVTINAAYSLKLEHEIGSIEPGKRANLTILGDNPLTVDPEKIRDIAVIGTVMEGRDFPAQSDRRKASLDLPRNPEASQEFAVAALDHAMRVVHGHEGN